MEDEKRTIGQYEVEHGIHIGDKEVLLCVNKKSENPFIVCYCDYNNPLSAPWFTDAVEGNSYLDAMEEFCRRVKVQTELVKAEHSRFDFDMTPFTKKDCIPDKRNESIIGKVVVMDTKHHRYEYVHSAYQLVYVDGGNGASGGRGNAVFGTELATGKRARWERYQVLGEIMPERMPQWAKKALLTVKVKEKKVIDREAR